MNEIDELLYNNELIEKLLGPKQQKIIKLFKNGYSIDEIAQYNNLTLYDVKKVFESSIKKIKLYLIKDMDIRTVDVSDIELTYDEKLILNFLRYGLTNSFIKKNSKYSKDEIDDLRIKILLPIYKKNYYNDEKQSNYKKY